MSADTSDVVTSKEPAKQVNISETKDADLESEVTSQEPGTWRYKSDRAELTELTPVEAFTWNVEGDQSPCRLIYVCLRMDANDYQSPKSRLVYRTKMTQVFPATVSYSISFHIPETIETLLMSFSLSGLDINDDLCHHLFWS
jgi:hypothetical protein